MKCGGNAVRKRGRVRPVLLFAVAVGVAVAAFFGWQMLDDRPDVSEFESLVTKTRPTAVTDAEVARIEAFCGDCHAVPLPDSFPRFAWHTEVRVGYEVYAKSGRTDLDPPPISQTVAYYRSHAPEALTFPTPEESSRPLGVSFDVEKLGVDASDVITPAVSHLRWSQLEPEGQPVLVVSDMRRGSVMAMDLADTSVAPKLLAQLNYPCHAEPCDLDGNGTVDLIVSDLGSFPPGDHQRGRVVWLSRNAQDESYEPIVIASGIGRVADARPGDFDGDGDLDIIVAVFGMDRTGRILLLRNVGSDRDGNRDPATLFEMETIDPRPGSIHVPPYDFNGDGDLDFAVGFYSLSRLDQAPHWVSVWWNQGAQVPNE